MRLIVIILIVPLSCAAALNADIYMDFETGTAGDALTTLILTNGTHGGNAAFSIAGSNTKEVAEVSSTLRGLVTVDGVTYSRTNATRGVRICLSQTSNYFQRNLPTGHASISLGFRVSFGSNGSSFQTVDRIFIGNAAGGFFVLQTDSSYNLQAHGDGAEGTGGHVTVSADTPYWVTMQYVQNGNCRLSVYNGSTWALVGQSDVDIDSNSPATFVRFGRTDSHGGNQPPDTSFDVYDDILIDTTNARYPLLPPGVFYVRSDGNANNPGTTNSASGAWATIATANTRASAPGDVVRVQSGTYTENVTVTAIGTASEPITWVGDGSPVVRGTITVSSAYRRFIGLTVDGQESRSSGFLLQSGSDCCQYWNNTVLNTTANAFRGDNGTGSQEENNCAFVGNFTSNNATAAFQIRGTNVLVAYNESYKDVVDFAVLSGSGHRYLNNWFHAQTGDPSAGGVHSDLFQNGAENGFRNHDHLFEANLQEDMGGDNFHGSNLQVGDDGNYGNLIFRGNVWTNNGSYTYGGDNTGSAWDYTNITVYNDTVLNARSASAASANDSNWTGTNQYFHNNLFDQAWGTSVSTATVYALQDGHDSDYNLFFDQGGNISYSATINGEANSLRNADPLLTGYRLGASSPAIGAAGPITTVTSTSGSGTSFTVARPAAFVGVNTNLFFYATNLSKGDTLTVGSDVVTVLSVAGNTVTVTPSFTWAQNDPVYWGTDTTPDIGAIPYSSTPLTAATISNSGSDYTVTPNGSCRWVVFYADGIPVSVAASAPYSATITNGTITAKAYALYAQRNPVVTASEAPVSPPATTTTLRAGAVRIGP